MIINTTSGGEQHLTEFEATILARRICQTEGGELIATLLLDLLATHNRRSDA
jgi:hypothetical protein